VPDQKPPRLATNELETLHVLLQFQRDSLVRKLADLDDDAARRPLVGSGTSLMWLVKHLAAAEITWVLSRFAGRDVDIPDETVGPGDTLVAVVAAYRATSARVDAAISEVASLDEVGRPGGDLPGVNLRWVMAHLLEETARHAGHADILREMIDGRTGR
jgi:uncharacterized damage-inducible protein DinB